PEYRAAIELDFPTDRRDELDALMGQLIDRVAVDLCARDVGAVRLTVRFDCVPAESVAVTVGLFRPTASAKHLSELVRLRCERLALPGPVERVALLATHTAPLEYRQGELFPDEARDADRHLGLLFERLGSRLG